jgi:predicted nuclease with TOPRIM domain
MTISDLHLECRAEETKLHDRIEELEAENKALRQMIEEYDAMQVKSNDLLSEQSAIIKRLREALETLAKTTNTPVLQPLHQIAKAALLKEGE